MNPTCRAFRADRARVRCRSAEIPSRHSTRQGARSTAQTVPAAASSEWRQRAPERPSTAHGAPRHAAARGLPAHASAARSPRPRFCRHRPSGNRSAHGRRQQASRVLPEDAEDARLFEISPMRAVPNARASSIAAVMARPAPSSSGVSRASVITDRIHAGKSSVSGIRPRIHESSR